MLEDGDLVTVIISDVEVGKNRVKLSEQSIESRATKIYCKNCLSIQEHCLDEFK